MYNPTAQLPKPTSKKPTAKKPPAKKPTCNRPQQQPSSSSQYDVSIVHQGPTETKEQIDARADRNAFELFHNIKATVRPEIREEMERALRDQTHPLSHIVELVVENERRNYLMQEKKPFEL